MKKLIIKKKIISWLDNARKESRHVSQASTISIFKCRDQFYIWVIVSLITHGKTSNQVKLG